MSNAHSSDVEDILDTLRLLDAAHEKQVATNGGVPLKTKESAKLNAIVDWMEKSGWVNHETCCEDHERERESDRDESRD